VNSVIEVLIEKNPEAVILVGFDDCLIGTTCICGKAPVAVYSTNMIIEKLQERDLDEEDAWTHYYHEIEMVDLGKHSPQMLNLDIT